jgi:hypothetical protein
MEKLVVICFLVIALTLLAGIFPSVGVMLTALCIVGMFLIFKE